MIRNKKFIPPYLQSLIKDHFGYICFDLGIISLIVIFLYLNLPRIPINQLKIKSLQKEIAVLQNNVETLNSTNMKIADLKNYLDFMNKLIPNSEDYFSLIYSLEQISQKTGFYIQSYSLNVKTSTKEKLNLSISGSGNREAFVKFLDTYTFAGGRLMTSDKLELNPQLEGLLKIDVTFYSKKISLNKNDQFQNALISLNAVKAMYAKINTDLKTAKNEVTDMSNYIYPTKSNPF